jgi:hypothetical protein
MKPLVAPTGRRIVGELVREMQDRLYPLFYRTLTAGVYHVYLHPDDYRDIEGVVPLIILDAQKALTARVAQLNRRARWSAMLTDHRTIESPSPGWEIHIHAEANGELKRGDIGIVSRLSMPAAPQFEGGTPTTRIVRTVVGASTRQSVTSEETTPPQPPPSVPPPLPAPAAPGVVATTQPPGRPQTATEKPPLPTVAADDGPHGFARLAYIDEQGPHVYAMTKDVVSIGRGGREHWVDVQLVTTPRVSREHCRIRRDERGRFFLHDLSTRGTSIDGKPVRAGTTGETAGSPAQELELPAHARIQLADAVVIEFQAQADGVVA